MRKRKDEQCAFEFMADAPAARRPRPRRVRPAKPVEVDEGPSEIDDDIQGRFLEFHADNPHIYDELAKLARQAKARGRRRYSIDLLFGRLRWQREIEAASDEPFKLNNDFRSRYARLLMAQEPDLSGLFEIRELARAGKRRPAA